MKAYRTIILLFLVFLGFAFRSQGQVTFNADNTGVIEAHPAAALEIQSSDRGVLPPRITSAVRKDMDIDSTMDGLLYFQTDGNIGFYLVQGGKWVFLNPILIPDDGTDNGPGADGETYSFARVAYTGDYNDLINKPNLSFGGTDENGDTITLSKVALTGDYRDLVDAPVIPSSMSDIATVAKTGRWSDLKNIPAIPTQLRDLEQDTLHMTLTGEERERWNAMASRVIPTSAQEFTADEEYMTVSTSDVVRWNTSAARKVPQSLADFPTDEFTQLATDEDIARWTLAAQQTPFTSLRELESDAEHRTITTTQKESWDRHAALTFPTYVGDFAEDVYFKKATLEEKNKWTRQAETPVPTKLSELRQDEFAQLVTDAEIAKWDSATRRVIPTSLRELESDAEHRAITTAQKEVWDQHAAVTIPSYVGDFGTDSYFKYVTYEDKDKWTRQAETPVPTKLSELRQDEFAQLVTDADIAFWNDAVARPVPKSLRDLAQDANHRTLTAAEIEKYTTGSTRKIPTSVGDLETDFQHRTFTIEQELTWDAMCTATGFSGDYRDLTNTPKLPDSLCQLLSDDFVGVVTRADKELWNSMATSSYKEYLSELKEDPEHMIPRTVWVNNWTKKATTDLPLVSTVAITGDYNDIPYKYQLADAYNYNPNKLSEMGLATGEFEAMNQSTVPKWMPIAESGDYRLLKNRPEETYKEFLHIKYEDFEHTPVVADIAYWDHGSFYDLIPEGKNGGIGQKDLLQKARYLGSSESTHVTQEQKTQFNNMVSNLEADYKSKYPNALFKGNYLSLKFNDNVQFPAATYLGDNPNEYADNSLLTVKKAIAMDKARMATLTSKRDNVKKQLPCGTVIFWAPEGSPSTPPDGWDILPGSGGRFPVGYAGTSSSYAKLVTMQPSLNTSNFETNWGEAAHVLTVDESPIHEHQLYRFNDFSMYNSLTGSKNVPSILANAGDEHASAGTYYFASEPKGDNAAHNNLPPYKALYMLIKTEGCNY